MPPNHIEQINPSRTDAVLYFRYAKTPMLGWERRNLVYQMPTPYEKALVQALIEGPGSLYPHFSPLFPKGTQVLSTQVQDDLLLVTFNEALLNPYPDEGLFNPASQAEGRLKRVLAMDSLVNTITENTSLNRVQVLVRSETKITDSMRLSARYYLEANDSILPPLTRSEAHLMTPRASSTLFCECWKIKDFSSLPYLSLSLSDKIPLLIDYSLSSGTVSPDGQNAIVLLNGNIQKTDGSQTRINALPLKLEQKEGLWVVTMKSLPYFSEIEP